MRTLTRTSLQNLECKLGYTERRLYLVTLLLDVYRSLKQISRVGQDATNSALLAWPAALIAQIVLAFIGGPRTSVLAIIFSLCVPNKEQRGGTLSCR